MDPSGGAERAGLVRSIPGPSDVSLDAKTIGQDGLLALVLILLIAFPADVFNSTLLANYDEVRGWLRLRRFDGFAAWVRGLPRPVALVGFAACGAVLSSELSPDIGVDRRSLALVLGLFFAILVLSFTYDVVRGWYMARRWDEPNQIAGHPIGFLVGVILVVVSRLAHFEPGYLYGMFTALRFTQPPNEAVEGRSLALASLGIGALGFGAWFLWSPVRVAAAGPDPAFATLVADAGLACFWIAALGAIVFGLVPMRFLYGEPVRHWSRRGHRLIWFAGILVFCAAVLNPGSGYYGTSATASFRSVLTLFLGFATVSFSFWGYFRYRHLWRREADDSLGPVEREL